MCWLNIPFSSTINYEQEMENHLPAIKPQDIQGKVIMIIICSILKI